MRTLLSLIAILYILSSCNKSIPKELEEAYATLPDQIEYGIHVKPILSDRCFACHGPDIANNKGGVRLDIADSAYRKAKSGYYPFVKNKPWESESIVRILTDEEMDRMPPIESHLTLTDREKAMLFKWVEQGAIYTKHWAFEKPTKKEVPEGFDNPIDAFLNRELTKNNMQFSEQADKATLIRRLFMDVTGLPPSLEQIEAFEKDNSPEAFTKLIEDAFGSTAYGERMAANWLDVSRYADSDGYLDDKHRIRWPWRDWVIKAFNENMPYDQFVIWQVAGDLLPNATKEQRLATGFSRNNKQNTEGGTIPEEFRVEYTADRAITTGKAILGLTLECAKCHDHKYDPISQKNFYGFYSFFNHNFENGRPNYGARDQVAGPAMMLTTDETDSIISFINDELIEENRKLKAIKPDNEFEYWEKEKFNKGLVAKTLNEKCIAYFEFESHSGKRMRNKADKRMPAVAIEIDYAEGYKGKGLKVDPQTIFAVPREKTLFERNYPFAVSFWTNPKKLHKSATIFYNCEHKWNGYQGYELRLDSNRLKFKIAHSYPQNALEIMAETPLKVDDWSQVILSYDGSSKAEGMTVYVNGEKQNVKILYNNLYKSITIPNPTPHLFVKYKDFKIGGRSNDPVYPGGIVDELKIYKDQIFPFEAQFLHAKEADKELELSPSAKELQAYYLTKHSKQFDDQRKSKRAVEERLFAITDTVLEVMVMEDMQEKRRTYVLDRGIYNAYGEEVEEHTPEEILPFEGYEKNRLGLAKWLFSADNPLTARVITNRIWQQYFGTGLVKTSDDFGNQGDLPTHPELLDYLAIWLVDHNWDLQALQKLIITSQAYQQKSVITPDHLEKDPENKLLARFPRYRYDAEIIRDNALASSGLLNQKIGGPPTYPYQPKGLWEELSTHSWRYIYNDPKDSELHRRSLYTVWKRTSPPPSMLIFDAPERDVCKVRRKNTSTPLQALVLLNDPQYVEAAKVLANNVAHESSRLNEKLIKCFQLLTGRVPKESEMRIMENLYKKEEKRFTDDPDATQEYLSTGVKSIDTHGKDTAVAALAVVASTIMNTDEFYTKK